MGASCQPLSARFALRLLTFWNRKLRAPLAYSVLTQFTAHVVVSTTVEPAVPSPTRSELTPTSFVPIQSVFTVSAGFRCNEPLCISVRYNGSWLSNSEGKGRKVILFEHVAPARAYRNSLKLPSCAA